MLFFPNKKYKIVYGGVDGPMLDSLRQQLRRSRNIKLQQVRIEGKAIGREDFTFKCTLHVRKTADAVDELNELNQTVLKGRVSHLR